MATVSVQPPKPLLPVSLSSSSSSSSLSTSSNKAAGVHTKGAGGAGGAGGGISMQEKKTAKAALRPFLDIGFSEEELVYALRRAGSNADEDDAYLALLLHIHPTPSHPSLSVTSADVIRDMDLAERNTVLREENDALESIYPGGLISIRRLCLLDKVCNVIDLSSDSDSSVLRVIVYNAHLYPTERSLVLGWYYDSSLPPQKCRDASLSAMKATQEALSDAGTAQVFDFIQHILSIVRGDANEQPLGVTDDNEAEYFENKKQGGSKTHKKQKSGAIVVSLPTSGSSSSLKDIGGAALSDAMNAATAIHVSASAQVQVPPSQPGKKLSETTAEYRSAFLKALNDGLSGMEARKSALTSLEFVLPRSVLDAIWKEEEAEEEIRKRAFDIEQLGKGGEIEATKQILSQGVALPKARVKALLATAKKNMIEEGRRFARNSEEMKRAWVKEAMQLHIQRLERDEAKAIKKQRQARRGPTLRDAYEILEERRAELQETDEYDEDDDDEDYDEDEEAEEVGQSERDSKKMKDEAAATLAKLDTSKSIFSPETCSALAAMKQMAKLRLNNGEENQSEQAVRREQQEELDSRRLINELTAKKESPAYRKMLETRSALPAFQMRDEIIKTIANNRVTVICGATGKSAQTRTHFKTYTLTHTFI
jgi:hypothetical protein